MPEYRTDPLSGHTVIIAPERQARPGAFSLPPWQAETVSCPFCRGKESETPQEICIYPREAAADQWQIRVVPNLYPALMRDGDKREGEGVPEPQSGTMRNPASAARTKPRPPAPLDKKHQESGAQASGLHEVIIESPEHLTSITDLNHENTAALLQTYADRLTSAAQQPNIKCAQLFKNHGPAAGATLQHSHSQLIAMDRVPDILRRELLSAEQHFAKAESCIVCDEIEQERSSGERMVLENDDFTVYCPFASRLPYEMRLVPNIHQAKFEDTNAKLWQSMAALLRQALQALESLIPNVCYNYLIHSLPFDTNRNEHYHWHMEIIPRIATPAGFEWGTGLFTNPIPPEQAASELRLR